MNKILVIDDDPLVLKTVEVALKKSDYAVTTAASADQAIACIKVEPFNLIVSDIRMPGKNGIEAIKEIRAIVNQNAPNKDIPIIFITGFAGMGEELNAEILGEVIMKPFDLEHLLNTIRDYL